MCVCDREKEGDEESLPTAFQQVRIFYPHFQRKTVLINTCLHLQTASLNAKMSFVGFSKVTQILHIQSMSHFLSQVSNNLLPLLFLSLP